jgi:Zn-dependent protease
MDPIDVSPLPPAEAGTLQAGLPATRGAAHNPFEPASSNPFGEGKQRRSLRKRIASGAAGVAALLAKIAGQLKALLILLPNAKLLLTAGTALVSVAAYSLFWGWEFAAGFVILLFIHEMGHAIQLRREGISASAPMFVPFLGAVIAARSLGDDAAAEARVGLAGPVLGTLGAAACFAIAKLTHSEFFTALAYVGFFINLFNLIPVVPLDGGRAMAAMAPALWFLGFGVIVTMTILFHNAIMLLIAVLAGFDLWRRWRHRNSGTLQSSAYYRVPRRTRLLVGLVYIALIVALAAGMHASHVYRAIWARRRHPSPACLPRGLSSSPPS